MGSTCWGRVQWRHWGGYMIVYKYILPASSDREEIELRISKGYINCDFASRLESQKSAGQGEEDFIHGTWLALGTTAYLPMRVLLTEISSRLCKIKPWSFLRSYWGSHLEFSKRCWWGGVGWSGSMSELAANLPRTRNLSQTALSAESRKCILHKESRNEHYFPQPCWASDPKWPGWTVPRMQPGATGHGVGDDTPWQGEEPWACDRQLIMRACTINQDLDPTQSHLLPDETSWPSSSTRSLAPFWPTMTTVPAKPGVMGRGV